MIELVNINKSYTHKNMALQALKNINLKVANAKVFGVIGKSGAGKSTLIRCVNLLEKPSSGQVYVAGKELTKLAPFALRQARRQIGMIFQHFNLLSLRTVYDNIALPLQLLKYSRRQIQQVINPLLELTGLSGKAHYYPAQLSGGQKQRVAIARALVYQPKVLLCDEATSALDLHTTHTILQLLKDINQKLGLTILLITHEIEVVKQICDHIALLDQGEIIEQASILDFFTKPQTNLAKDFVFTALKHELPPMILSRLKPVAAPGTNPVLKILFHGQAALQPLIADLVQKFGIKVNILQANIDFLQNNILGVMTVEILETQHRLTEAITYLQAQHVQTEIIGYVE